MILWTWNNHNTSMCFNWRQTCKLICFKWPAISATCISWSLMIWQRKLSNFPIFLSYTEDGNCDQRISLLLQFTQQNSFDFGYVRSKYSVVRFTEMYHKLCIRHIICTNIMLIWPINYVHVLIRSIKFWFKENLVLLLKLLK